jgi:small subunit ribosomal protein S21
VISGEEDNTSSSSKSGSDILSGSETRKASSNSSSNGHHSKDSRSGGSRSAKENKERSEYRVKDGIPSEKPDKFKPGALEVSVENNIEKAMKILKRKLIKEGLFKELKSRRYYEKPSERRKRKFKESMKKIRKEEARAKKNQQLF